jgi:hypothetical protein
MIAGEHGAELPHFLRVTKMATIVASSNRGMVELAAVDLLGSCATSELLPAETSRTPTAATAANVRRVLGIFSTPVLSGRNDRNKSTDFHETILKARGTFLHRRLRV